MKKFLINKETFFNRIVEISLPVTVVYVIIDIDNKDIVKNSLCLFFSISILMLLRWKDILELVQKIWSWVREKYYDGLKELGLKE